MTYYHGGKGGLRVGMFILPPSITGARSTSDYGIKVCRRDRIYITTSDKAALIFGALHRSGEGCAYIVEPVGEVSPDPDCDPSTEFESFECERARIVKVLRIYPSVRDDILRRFVKGSADQIKAYKAKVDAEKGAA